MSNEIVIFNDGDVNIEIVVLRGKILLAAEVVQFGIDFLEVPRIVERNLHGDDFRFRGAGVNVFHNPFEKRLKTSLIDNIILVELEVLLHGKGNRRTPHIPSSGSVTMSVQCATKKRDENVHSSIYLSMFYKILYTP